MKWYFYLDTEQNFDANMARDDTRSLLTMNGWTKDSITYELTQEVAPIRGGSGYRGSHKTGGAMFLGCSNTFGVGMEYESMWSTIVSEKIGLHQNNFAMPGYSSDACFREVITRIDVRRPEAVFMLAPPDERMEFRTAEGQRLRVQSNIFLPENAKYRTNLDNAIMESEGFFNHWFFNEENVQYNAAKNRLAIAALCQQRDIPFYYQRWADNPLIEYDRARDNIHPGRKWNLAVAEKFLEMIKGA